MTLNIIHFPGFEIGCVSSERYHKMCKMERNIADGIQLLKSIVKPATHWRELLRMPTSKATLLKRYVTVTYNSFAVSLIRKHCNLCKNRGICVFSGPPNLIQNG